MNTFSTPPVTRRLACMLYESMLLFGVIFVAGWVFSTLLEQRHALYLRNALQDWLFVVIGLYFVWFWTHGGQTLAMQTWRIRLVTHLGQPVKPLRAIWRYALAWLWVAPGLAASWWHHATGWTLLLFPALNILLWALTVYLDPEQRFLHDRIAGTRLISIENGTSISKKSTVESVSTVSVKH